MTNKEAFINKANIKYDYKFDYSKFEYTNAKTKSIIICPLHGEFIQCPDKHLTSIFSCKLCEKLYKRKTSTKGKVNLKTRIAVSEFESMFYKKYGQKYKLDLCDYSGIAGNKIGVICETHGISKFFPNNIRNIKVPCNQCSIESRAKSKAKPYDVVVDEFLSMYGGKYIYPRENAVTYKNKKSIIKIICNEHGEFMKSAQKHLSGQGCFRCAINTLINDGKLLGGYSDVYFQNNPHKKNERSILYYVKVGNLYKIGITTNLQNRIKSIKSESKKDVDILLIKEYNLYDSFNIEQTILNEFLDVRTYRSWSTELFISDIQDNILKYFKEV